MPNLPGTAGIEPIAVEVGRRKLHWFCLEFGYPVKKSAKIPYYPSSKASEERTANLVTKSAVVPAFIQYGLEFREYK